MTAEFFFLLKLVACGVSSFVTKFTVFSKLVICAVMLMGVHRELPEDVDKAITLPATLIDANEARVSITLDRLSFTNARSRSGETPRTSLVLGQAGNPVQGGPNATPTGLVVNVNDSSSVTGSPVEPTKPV